LSRPIAFVSGGFDNLNSGHIRFLEETARLGEVRVCLWTDAALQAATGNRPNYPMNERRYLLESLRFVSQMTVHADGPDLLPDGLPARGGSWAMRAADLTPAREAYCKAAGVSVQIVPEAALKGFPVPDVQPADGRDKVVVTGCYDWLHSGHVRFFEEVSELGELLVAVGNDANVRHLKGEGHPLQPQDERRYMVGAIRYVTQALITSGHGWMDAEPDIARLKPDMYAVNEDGDKPEKRAFCAGHGLAYVVLKRTPKAGLSRRSSTDLRGF